MQSRACHDKACFRIYHPSVSSISLAITNSERKRRIAKYINLDIFKTKGTFFLQKKIIFHYFLIEKRRRTKFKNLNILRTKKLFLLIKAFFIIFKCFLLVKRKSINKNSEHNFDFHNNLSCMKNYKKLLHT